jgi:hypothetical protein
MSDKAIVARVKKIIAADDDISNCSNNAAFMVTVAAEMFLQHLVQTSYEIVKSERKPRRNIQYRDVANAVARVENLEFLSDVVPKTTTFRQFKNHRSKLPAPFALEPEKTPISGPASHTPSDQLRMEDVVPNRMIRPEEHAAPPPTEVPSSDVEIIVERQATNGAGRHDGDAMEVDEVKALPISALTEPTIEGS